MCRSVNSAKARAACLDKQNQHLASDLATLLSIRIRAFDLQKGWTEIVLIKSILKYQGGLDWYNIISCELSMTGSNIVYYPAKKKDEGTKIFPREASLLGGGGVHLQEGASKRRTV